MVSTLISAGLIDQPSQKVILIFRVGDLLDFSKSWKKEKTRKQRLFNGSVPAGDWWRMVGSLYTAEDLEKDQSGSFRVDAFEYETGNFNVKVSATRPIESKANYWLQAKAFKFQKTKDFILLQMHRPDICQQLVELFEEEESRE
jgi:hypothetical protein